MSTATDAVQQENYPQVEQGIYDSRIRTLLERALKHSDSFVAHALLDRARSVVGVAVKRYESSCPLNPWLRAIELYVEDHLDSKIDVSALAAITGLSLSHFHRLFHRRYGMTPATYIRACRVRRAQALMMRVDARLADIALDCGFADQAHLSRVFKRVVGANPKTWRSGSGGPGPAPISFSTAQ